MEQTRETIKTYFNTGDKPTEEQYHDTWDSFVHKDDIISANNYDSNTLQQITDVSNSTTNDIELIGGNLTITDGDEPANPFQGNLNINYEDENSGNAFSIYNAIVKTKSAINQFFYGISNLINHDAPDDIGQVRGFYNRVRSLNSGTPGQLVGTFNEVYHRNTGSGDINLVSASENYIRVEDYGGTGKIDFAVGFRAKIVHNNANLITTNAYNGYFELDLDAGIIEGWAGLHVDVNQSGGTINSGQFIRLDGGIQLPNENVKAINSLVDLPSYFKGSIESDITIAQIESANDKVLTTKEWVQANSTSKFSETIGDGTLTTINVSHNLESEDVIVQVRDVNTKTVIDSTITIIDSNSISLTFDNAPALDSHRVVVIA